MMKSIYQLFWIPLQAYQLATTRDVFILQLFNDVVFAMLEKPSYLIVGGYVRAYDERIYLWVLDSVFPTDYIRQQLPMDTEIHQ